MFIIRNFAEAVSGMVTRPWVTPNIREVANSASEGDINKFRNAIRNLKDSDWSKSDYGRLILISAPIVVASVSNNRNEDLEEMLQRFMSGTQLDKFCEAAKTCDGARIYSALDYCDDYENLVECVLGTVSMSANVFLEQSKKFTPPWRLSSSFVNTELLRFMLDLKNKVGKKK